MPKQIIFTDGNTTKSFDPLVDGWSNIGGKPIDRSQSAIEVLYNRVAWLRRGVGVVSSNVSNVPFIITQNGEEVDNSLNYQNVVGFFPHPQRTIGLASASRQLAGKAYFWNVRNENGVFKGLKYLNPLTVEEVYNDGKPTMVNGRRVPTGGLLGFKRTLTGEGRSTTTVPVNAEDITFMWLTDAYVEIGPAVNYPAKAALAASGVLDNIDVFVGGYFARGLIKASIILLSGTAKKEERDKLEKWWQKWLTGVRNASINKVLNADQVKVETIGEGLEGLEDNDLTDTKREDIAAAFGIPESKLFSKDAGGLGGGGVVEADDRRFMNETIIPETEEIYDVLNDRIFEPQGFLIHVNKKAIDVFQEDENERSQSMLNLTTAFTTNPAAAKLSASILGYELSEEEIMAIDGLIALQLVSSLPPERDVIQVDAQPVEEIQPPEIRMLAAPTYEVKPDPALKRIINDLNMKTKEVSQWQRHALRKGGELSSVEFGTEYLDGPIELFIREFLVIAPTEAEIKSVFAVARELIDEGGDGPFLYWEHGVMKAYRNNQPLDFEPVGEYAKVTKAAIISALGNAKSIDDIRRVFAGVKEFSVYP